MIVQYLALVAVGKIFMYLWKMSPYARWMGQLGFFRELFGCDLCFGVWVYSLLMWVYQIDVLNVFLPYKPILTEMILGGVTSLGMFLLSLGWMAQFGTYKVEG